MVVRILITFCGNDTIHRVDSLSAGAFQYDRSIGLDMGGAGLPCLSQRSSLASPTPLRAHRLHDRLWSGDGREVANTSPELRRRPTELYCNNLSFQAGANRNLPEHENDCTDDRGGLKCSIEIWKVLIAGEKDFQ